MAGDDILAAEDLPIAVVATPEWAKHPETRVRGLSADDAETWGLQFTDLNGKRTATPSNIRARLLVTTIVDEAGERIFTDDQAPALGKKSAVVIKRLFDKVLELSGLGQDQGEALEEGFEQAQQDSSASA